MWQMEFCFRILWLSGLLSFGIAKAYWDDDEFEDESVGSLSNGERCDTVELNSVYREVAAKEVPWTGKNDLDMYHVNAFHRHISNLFLDVCVQLNLTDEQTYQIYQGSNCSVVLEHYSSDQRLFGLLRHVKLLRSKQLNPFERTVVAIDTAKPYTVRARVWAINYIRLCGFVGAVLLYLMSRSLARNALFYYTSGCALGLVSSLLLIGFIVFRLTPKRWATLPIMFGGWSLSFYLLYAVWQNFASLVMQYQKLVVAYFTTVVLISFAICYRYGPPTNVRSHNLAQWALQLIALTVIFCSAQISEVALLVIAVLLLWSLTKNLLAALLRRTFRSLSMTWNMMFPPTRRLLSKEEYDEQGILETKKALEELRSYCHSPDAKPWKIANSLRNPKRFAKFLNRSADHVSEHEIELYEDSLIEELTDDSGEDEVAKSRIAYSNRGSSLHDSSTRQRQRESHTIQRSFESADESDSDEFSEDDSDD